MNKMIFPLFAFLFFSKMLVAQVDTVPPVLVCKNTVTVNIGQNCYKNLWVTDFIDGVSDNLSPNTNIELGLRRFCAGTGFPVSESIRFTADDFEVNTIEAWARDSAGNTDSCLISVEIYDPTGTCAPSSWPKVWANTPDDKGIIGVNIEVEGYHCLYDSTHCQKMTALFPNSIFPFALIDSCFFGNGFGYSFNMTPTKNTNFLNGVTTYDLVLIQKHILGIELLDSPRKLIAADANQDGKVTTLDIITLRKLILGLTNELPNGKSWRFVPLDYFFPNFDDPFQPPFPERIERPRSDNSLLPDYNFVGIKIGDVNYSADPNQ